MVWVVLVVAVGADDLAVVGPKVFALAMTLLVAPVVAVAVTMAGAGAGAGPFSLWLAEKAFRRSAMVPTAL